MKNTALLFIAFLFILSSGFSQTVIIGTQTWTSLNLDVAAFRNGDVILEAKTNEEWQVAGNNKQAAWCYYENDAKNGTKYGKLYNWYAANDVRGLAPAGWHIPTDEEWTVLYTFLGGEEVAGEKMKFSSGWSENRNGTNSSGFAGLPGGFRFVNGDFDELGFGFWWSSSEIDDSAAGCSLNLLSSLTPRINVIYMPWFSKAGGMSIRCVKD